MDTHIVSMTVGREALFARSKDFSTSVSQSVVLLRTRHTIKMMNMNSSHYLRSKREDEPKQKDTMQSNKINESEVRATYPETRNTRAIQRRRRRLSIASDSKDKGLCEETRVPASSYR